MAVRIRLSRVGAKKKPLYRVVVADSRMCRNGRFIEIIGRYNPKTEPSFIEIDREKALKWLAQGAQPSEAVERLLEITGIREEFETHKDKYLPSGRQNRQEVTS
ncbi:MAG: 30S ribosomal protein S16 [Actinomycetota bacterium]